MLESRPTMSSNHFGMSFGAIIKRETGRRALLAQFTPLEDSLRAMGVTVWPMVELEADDALASAAEIASKDARVEQICIWTPDKISPMRARGSRCAGGQRTNVVRDASGVRAKLASIRSSSPTTLRSWVMLRTAIPASRALVRRARQRC